MRKTLLIGYLGKDPEMKYTAGGTAITTFSLASTERWKNGAGEPQEHTEWFNIKAFGKRAEIVTEHLHKGSRIFLEGRQRTESWDDKQPGGKKYMTFVYADKIESWVNLGGVARRASSRETSPTARKIPP